MKREKTEREEAEEIIENVRSGPLGATCPVELTNEQAVAILKSGGRTLDKTGTPFEGIDELMERTMHDIQDAFNVTDGVVDEIKKYGFNKKEIEFIKNAEPRKPFHFKRLKGKTFVKTGDNLLLTADEYLKRLESGIIKLDKAYDELQQKYDSLESENKELQNRFTGLKFLDRIVLACKLVFKGEL